jgi:hypothetical protein
MKNEKRYADKTGKEFEEQFLWDIFMEWVEGGTYPDYSDESFAKYLKSEGLKEVK